MRLSIGSIEDSLYDPDGWPTRLRSARPDPHARFDGYGFTANQFPNLTLHRPGSTRSSVR
jgi:hypothetical protein